VSNVLVVHTGYVVHVHMDGSSAAVAIFLEFAVETTDQKLKVPKRQKMYFLGDSEKIP